MWAWGIIVGFVSILLGLVYFRTFRLSPDALPSQIHSDGGKFIQLMDGRIAEYFLFGAWDSENLSSNSDVLVLFHGYQLSGSAASSWHDIAHRKGVRIVSPSMAGWGGSTPLRGRSFEVAGMDAYEILHSLNLDDHQRLHIMGISFGSGNAAAMALLKPQLVSSLSLVIPAWPNMDTHNFWQSSDFMMWITGQPFLDRLWQYYVVPHLDIPSLLKTLMPEEWSDMEANHPNFVDGLTKELKRSTKYHLEGACDAMRMFRNEGNKIFEKKHILRSLGEKVSIWYALNDTVAPAHHGRYLSELLPLARSFPKLGRHLSMFDDLEPFLNDALSK